MTTASPIQIHHLLTSLDHLAPFALAEEWDNVGLLLGHPLAPVGSILLGLDPSQALLDEAISLGATTIITHHPCIFHPLRAIFTSTPTGRFLAKALQHQINVIACHTNLDNAPDGVSDTLALALGLSNLSPLRPGPVIERGATGAGRLGRFARPLSATSFMNRLLQVLQLPSVCVAGNLPAQIKTVGLCGGSGSELAEIAHNRGADLYLSAEIKHSVARWAEESGFCIIDGTHYGTEQPVLSVLHRQLQALAASNNWPLEILVSRAEKSPFSLYQTKNNTDTSR
jgi:dinuclear metal center YbgI/SA1388 family protein